MTHICLTLVDNFRSVLSVRSKLSSEGFADTVSLLGNQDYVTITSAGEEFYYHSDPAGLVRESTGRSTGTIGYELLSPFGEQLAASGIRTDVLFPGQITSDVLGTVFSNRYRDYVPMLGRYLQPEPFFRSDIFSPYLYASGDPLSMTDPLGLWVELRCQGIDVTAIAWFGIQHCYVRVVCEDLASCAPQAAGSVTGNFADTTYEINGPAEGTIGLAECSNPARFINDNSQLYRSWESSENCYQEKCIRQAFEIYAVSKPEYGYRKNNSNTFAFHLLTSCGYNVDDLLSGTVSGRFGFNYGEDYGGQCVAP